MLGFDILTTVLNAFKIEAKDVDKVSDVLFTTVRLGKTTLSELSSSLAQVAPLASASGVKFEEIAAAIATLTKQGTPLLRLAAIRALGGFRDASARTILLRLARSPEQPIARAARGAMRPGPAALGLPWMGVRWPNRAILRSGSTAAFSESAASTRRLNREGLNFSRGGRV